MTSLNWGCRHDWWKK